MFGFPYPACQSCGAFYADAEVHQEFHDAIGLLYQKVFGFTDEEYERNTGNSAAERDARLIAAAEKRKGATGEG